jgi:hypothetical protein
MVYVNPTPSVNLLLSNYSLSNSSKEQYTPNSSHESENKRFGLYHIKLIFNKEDKEIKSISRFFIKSINLDKIRKKLYYPILNSFIKDNKEEFYNYDYYQVSIRLNRECIFSQNVPINSDWNKTHFFPRLEELISDKV